MFLRLENLPSQANEEAIREFFFGFHIPINCVRLYYNGHRKEASVWFQTENDLLTAFSLNGKSMYEQPLKLILSTEDPSDPTSQKPLSQPKSWETDSSESMPSYDRTRTRTDRRQYTGLERSESREHHEYAAKWKMSTRSEQNREREIQPSQSRGMDDRSRKEGRHDFERSGNADDARRYSINRDQDRYASRRDEAEYDLHRFEKRYDVSSEGEQRKRNQSGDGKLMHMNIRETRILDDNKNRDERYYVLPKNEAKDLALERIEYTQDPMAYMMLINSMGSGSIKRSKSPNSIDRPRSRSPIRRNPVRLPFTPMRSETHLMERSISPMNSENMPLPRPVSPPSYTPTVKSPLKSEPMKQQPIMSLFPNFGNRQRFYLQVSRLPPNKTASEVWSWVHGTRGKAEGVIFGRVPPDHSLCVSSRAFIVFDYVQDLLEAQHLLTLHSTMMCSPADANLFLQKLDSKCQIWVTSRETRNDIMLTLEERVQIYFKKSSALPTATIAAEQDSPNLPRSESFPLSTDVVPVWPRSGVQQLKRPVDPIPPHQFMLLFPSFLSGRRFYLEIVELPSRIRASQVWSWVDGVRGKSDGVILSIVPPNHSLFTSSRAFIVFEYKQDLFEMMPAIPAPPDQVSLCAPEDVNLYLQQLDDKCQIWVTNRGENRDSRLTLREREEVLVKAEPGLLGNAPGLLGETPNMSTPNPAPHRLPPNRGIKSLPPASPLGDRPVVSLLSMSVKPVPMKTEPFMSLFPSFLNGIRFYLEASDLPPDVSASHVWSWVMGTRGKSEGVILGSVPQEHYLMHSRAFIVYERERDLFRDQSQIPTPTVQCSPVDVNQFLKALDMRCQIYVTNPAIGKDVLLTIQERRDIIIKAD